MSVPRRLFAKELSNASTDATVADLLYTAPFGGPTMVMGLWLAPSQGGTANVVRLHHLLPVGEETPASSNIFFRGTISNAESLNKHYDSCKIILQPGERLMGRLQAGNAVTVHAYGLEPRSA